jgi:glutathione synthase/RimK-type ligase-like ATP-grasp enzyme/gamma-glutamyl:cysteine ligase YbdK (ATP-grasp superfamily)
VSLGDYDALFIRTLTGLNQPAFRFATKAEALGMPVVDDTQSIIRCSNKVFLHELLKREGVPMPRTIVVTPHTRFEQIEKELGLPVILKLPDGSFSTAVHKLSSRTDYREKTAEMFQKSPLLVAQAYTPTDFDWRVTTLGGKVLFVAKYHMAKGHWQIRAADARGVRFGKVEAVPRQYAPRDVVRVALKAAALIGDGFYGVDMKETKDGPVVIEVNDNPNLDVGYDDAADGNAIYQDLIQHFLDKVDELQKPETPRAPRRETDVVLRALRRPIGPTNREIPNTGYRAFEVSGLELEYATVDRDLNVVPLVEPLLATLAGRPTSDVELGSVGFSNEIVDHVFEIKVPVPSRSLVKEERWLAEAVRRVSALLEDNFDARLMPTGMHPWFDPRKANLWVRSNAKIYGTYERIFDVRTHGWANVQACHVNLPLGLDDEATAMMNAAALLVPYLPAIAASSPMYAGELQAAVDNRLAFIVGHQERIPESTGFVVPEYVRSLKEYKKNVLQPMYEAVDRLPDAAAIRREFLNARGAVIKFSRKSMEIRVLDMQECVKMDVAIAAFVKAALRALSERVRGGKILLPDHALLVSDFHQTVRHGTRAEVLAPHLRTKPGEEPVSVREALERLVELARSEIRKDEEPYLDLVAQVAEQGSLAERIALALQPYVEDEDGFTDAARRVYVELTDCLRYNEPWPGRRTVRVPTESPATS